MDEENDLTSAMRRLLTELRDELRQLETRIATISREIEAGAATRANPERAASPEGEICSHKHKARAFAVSQGERKTL